MYCLVIDANVFNFNLFVYFFFTFQFRLPFEFRFLWNSSADNSELKHAVTIFTHKAGDSFLIKYYCQFKELFLFGC